MQSSLIADFSRLSKMERRSRQAKKKPRKESGTQTQIWFKDDIAQLLAWLDYCLENDRDFKSTVVDYLFFTRKRIYTVSQVRHKLGSIWRQLGENRPGIKLKSTIIYKEGTACLEGLSNDMKTQATLDRNGKGTLRYLQNARLSTPDGPSRPDDAQRQATSPLTSIGSSPRMPSPYQSIDFQAHFGPGGTGECKRPSKLSSTEQVKVYENDHVVLEAQSLGETSNLLTRDEYIPTIPSYLPQKPHEAPTACVTKGSILIQPSPSGNFKEWERLSLEVAEKDMTIAHQRAELLSRENRIFQLETQLSSVCTELKELQQCLNVPNASDPASTIMQLQHSVSCLKHQLSATEAFQKDLRKPAGGSFGPGFGDIRMKMDALEGKIYEACADLREKGWVFVQNGGNIPAQDPELRMLFQRSIGSASCDLYPLMSKDNTGQLNLLRALVAASVSISAFETPFMDLFKGESVLLDKYRDCLMLRDGALKLQDIDTLAHQRTISEPYFESEIIGNKSKASAARLARVLASLLTAKSNLDADTKMECGLIDASGGTEDSLHHTVTASFTDIFADAMRLRATLIVTRKRYQAIFPKPGQQFRPSTMHKDAWNYDGYTTRHMPEGTLTSRRSNDSTTNLHDEVHDQEVKMCLFPAIYWYSPASANSPHPGSEAKKYVVDYNNFIGQDEAVLDASSAKVISKAVVLI
ncbi:hypothetical protein RRF57_006806 [Xylaria bambusicola]|uniref:Uncharacterized protein n=1 Tax=Xylaria bambusicola TaxID=326684 RepID=A0AAN7USQ9_9PEZI